MTGIYGRATAKSASESSDSSQMGTRLFANQSAVDVATLNPTGNLLGWLGSVSRQISSSEAGGISVAIVGQPRWNDSRLARIGASDGDAEAVRVAYSEVGERAIRQLYGSFALSIVDDRRNHLILAIDRMGIERMCYSHDRGDSLTYGTSLNDIKLLRDKRSKISNQALFDYLYFHVIPCPESIYENVFKLEPGQLLIFNGDNIHFSQYWVPEFLNDQNTTEAELKIELFKKIESSVSRCKFSQDSGCFLSGGLDSSTVTGFASKSSSSRVDAFTIGFDQPGYDEVEFARAAANHFNTNIIEYYVTPDDIAATVDEIAIAYDEPFGNSSAIPTLFCAKLASKHGKTHLLAGDGGDELFAGNERYQTQSVFEYYSRVPKWIKSALLEPAFVGKHFDFVSIGRKARRYIEQANIPMPERLQTYNTLHVNKIDDVFNDDFLAKIDSTRPISAMREWYDKVPNADFLHRMLFFDWKLTLADNDVRKVNVMCEHANIRVSYPMLDDELVEFSTRIPSLMKMRRRHLRRFFKKSFADFLPEVIQAKSKHGFGLPFGEWLKTSAALQQEMYPSLDLLGDRGIVKKSFIDSMRHKHKTEHAAYYGGVLWTLVMLERWLQKNL